MAADLLDVAGIETCYGQSQVLFGLSLAIASGEMVTLMGRNGMGKTTTVRSIMGLSGAMAGSIRFDGREIRDLPSYRIARAGLFCHRGGGGGERLDIAFLELGQKSTAMSIVAASPTSPANATLCCERRVAMFCIGNLPADSSDRSIASSGAGSARTCSTARSSGPSKSLRVGSFVSCMARRPRLIQASTIQPWPRASAGGDNYFRMASALAGGFAAKRRLSRLNTFREQTRPA